MNIVEKNDILDLIYTINKKQTNNEKLPQYT